MFNVVIHLSKFRPIHGLMFGISLAVHILQSSSFFKDVFPTVAGYVVSRRFLLINLQVQLGRTLCDIPTQYEIQSIMEYNCVLSGSSWDALYMSPTCRKSEIYNPHSKSVSEPLILVHIVWYTDAIRNAVHYGIQLRLVWLFMRCSLYEPYLSQIGDI